MISVFSAPLLRKDNYAIVIEERKRQAEEDRIKKEEADKKKKEEQEQKKKDNAQKKKEEEERKKVEMEEQRKLEKVDMKTKMKETMWRTVDTMLKPFEDSMDPVVGVTIDPFADRRYICWLSLVTLAFNYNTWLVTARLCFPYHTSHAIPFWFAADLLADLVYLLDSILFQSRKQFVKGGDIIVSVTGDHQWEWVRHHDLVQ